MDSTPSKESEDPPGQRGSTHEIHVSADGDVATEDRAAIVKALRFALEKHGRPSSHLSVVMVTDETMARLHGQYMGIPEPTDVLTFDLDEEDPESIDGEIIISVDTATREAAERGHARRDELTLYAIHGLLHLLGYDDLDEDSARRMHEREDELLTELGIGPVFKGASR